MTKVKGNVFLNSGTGMIGNLVVTSDGKARLKPDTSKRIWSPAQVEHLSKMERAKDYGRMVIRDPELNAYYGEKATHKKGLGAWHLAIMDYFQEPALNSVQFHDFNGRKGSEMYVLGGGTFKLKEVRVTILNAGGEIIEEGQAFAPVLTDNWRYQLQKDFDPGTKIDIRFRIMSLPGHVIEKQLVVTGKENGFVHFEPKLPGVSSRPKQMKSQLRMD